MVLLIGAGLLVRSMLNRLAVGVGFDTGQLLTAEIEVPNEEYEGRMALFFEDLVGRAAALPGVEAASAITWAPLAGGGTGTSIWVTDRPIARSESAWRSAPIAGACFAWFCRRRWRSASRHSALARSVRSG